MEEGGFGGMKLPVVTLLLCNFTATVQVNLQIACVLVSRRPLIISATDIGRVLLGSSKSPDFKMGVTSEIFQALGNVHAAKELLNMLVRIGSVAGRLYLRILALTLSIPGALLEGRDLIIFSTSASATNWKLKAA